MSDDIKEQIITEIKDKSRLVCFLSKSMSLLMWLQSLKLMVFVRYAVNTSVKEEFFFCSAPDTNTKASDVMEKVDHFFNENGIAWKIYEVCALMEPQRCLGPKVDFEHLWKRRHLTFCSLIASFTRKLWLPKLCRVDCKMYLKLLSK